MVVSVTQSKAAFIQDSWIKPGGILFPMGSYQECEDLFILNADKIVVDHAGQCLHRGALKKLNEEGRITEEHLYATIGELAVGRKPGRSRDEERILCIPIGTGAMDVAVASIVLDRAKAQGLGGTFSFV